MVNPYSERSGPIRLNVSELDTRTQILFDGFREHFSSRSRGQRKNLYRYPKEREAHDGNVESLANIRDSQTGNGYKSCVHRLEPDR